MSSKIRKIVAVLVLIVILVGGYAMVSGIGGKKPIKDGIKMGLDIQGGVHVVMEAQNVGKYKTKKLRELMEQTQAVITKRVDAMGIANPNVTIEGTKRIRVELPGAKDADEAIKQIGKTAQLKFTLADNSFVMDGSNIKDASMGTNQERGGFVVNLKFDSKGAEAFEKASEKAFSGTVKSLNKNIDNKAIIITLDNRIISHPTVQGKISGDGCEISGSFTKEEASNLAALIRGGSLPVEMKEIRSSTQAAKIGVDALDKSVKAGIIGVLVIFLIMLIGYRLMGVAANIALTLYILIVLTIMAMFGSVLNLPGVAGIIVAIGMAVDSNVIIFTRIKEEIIGGKSVRSAVQSGFRRAIGTVIDSQITTLIAAVILYQMGTSSVKGFAFTLMLGILVSIFTAVVVTQVYLRIFSETKKFSDPKYYGIRKDGKASFQITRQFNFIKHRKKFYAISLAILILGAAFVGFKGFNFGIDFTGGTMFQINFGKYVPEQQIQKVLSKENIKSEIVYSGKNNKEAIIRTTKALDTKERAEVVDSLQKEFKFNDRDVMATKLFEPSVGKELTKGAFKALLLAAIGMLIYIRLRFRKWKFGAASILGVIHDTLILLSFYAIFSVPVNNAFIAAILTVVGYSINDTIVVFDRIRENNRFMRKGGVEEIIDVSINQTISRSVMTSVTTLVVLVALLIVGSPALREFVLPLMIGILAGTYSSIFLCSPFYYQFSVAGKQSDYEKLAGKAQKAKRKQMIEDAKETFGAKEDDRPVSGEGAEDLYIPKADTTRSKKDVYKGKKKQSRKNRKGNN